MSYVWKPGPQQAIGQQPWPQQNQQQQQNGAKGGGKNNRRSKSSNRRGRSEGRNKRTFAYCGTCSNWEYHDQLHGKTCKCGKPWTKEDLSKAHGAQHTEPQPTDDEPDLQDLIGKVQALALGRGVNVEGLQEWATNNAPPTPVRPPQPDPPTHTSPLHKSVAWSKPRPCSRS